SAEPPSALPGSHAWSSGQGSRLSSASRPTRTCSGTRVVTHWPPRGTIRGHCRHTLGIATFSTLYDTPNCRQHGLRVFGESRRLSVTNLRSTEDSVANDYENDFGNAECS